MAFMLLSSAMPFYGANRVKVIKRILNNKYAFRGRRWTTISSEAKDFIQKILVPDPEERWDPETALQSPWLQQMAGHGTGENNGGGSGSGTTQWTLSAEQEEMVRASILKYARYPKLKKMVRFGTLVGTTGLFWFKKIRQQAHGLFAIHIIIGDVLPQSIYIIGTHGRGSQVQQR